MRKFNFNPESNFSARLIVTSILCQELIRLADSNADSTKCFLEFAELFCSGYFEFPCEVCSRVFKKTDIFSLTVCVESTFSSRSGQIKRNGIEFHQCQLLDFLSFPGAIGYANFGLFLPIISYCTQEVQKVFNCLNLMELVFKNGISGKGSIKSRANYSLSGFVEE